MATNLSLFGLANVRADPVSVPKWERGTTELLIVARLTHAHVASGLAIVELAKNLTRFLDGHRTVDDTLDCIDREKITQAAAAYAATLWLPAQYPGAWSPAPAPIDTRVQRATRWRHAARERAPHNAVCSDIPLITFRPSRYFQPKMAARRCYRYNMRAAHRAARPGFIRLAIERRCYDTREVTRRVVAIAATLTRIFECARERNIATNRAADELVEERLEAAA